MADNLGEIKNIMQKLCDEINFHNKKYYEENSPIISDYEYDRLYRKLENLEKKYPELVLEDSPTKKIGGNINIKFSPVEHDIPLQSLHDSFSYKEIRDFDKRVNNKLGEKFDYVIEPKIDGLSVSLEYKNGIFVRGSTRGNGLVGENITENISVIRSVPLKIKEKLPYLEVRGEVYISEKNFVKLRETQEKNGEKIFKNPRNAAAGSLRQKEASITKERNLDIIIFNLQRITGKEIAGHKESIDYLQYLGFKTIPFCKVCSNIEDAIKEIQKIGELRSKFSFPLDGAVVKINSFKQREILGNTAKFPRWAEAFKYPPEEKETKLLKIELNVGRTGVITPIAVFEPVILAGTSVSRAVLHNEEFINNKNIYINDIITVRKAGEIIPEVVSVKSHSTDSKKFCMPKTCPSCGSVLVKEHNETALRCKNFNCRAQTLRNIVHFASKNAMNIEGLGSAIITELLNKNLIKNVSDIYNLTHDDLTLLVHFKEKSINNLLNSIKKSKDAKLSNLIYALGIKNVGLECARILENNYKFLENLAHTDTETLKNINGIGEIVAKNIVNYFKVSGNLDLIKNLKKLGINPGGKKIETIVKNNDINNKTFVITGTLPSYSRNDITKIILENGGKVAESVSKKTNFLLAGEKAGNKLKKAAQLGVRIISEKEFLKLI